MAKSELELMEELAAWLSAGQKLRRQLLEERRDVEARLEQIDRLLRHLPTDGEEVLAQVATPPKRTAADAIREVLRTYREGLTAREVAAEVQRLMPLDDSHIVHATLSRLANSGELVAEGERGKQVYKFKEVAIPIVAA